MDWTAAGFKHSLQRLLSLPLLCRPLAVGPWDSTEMAVRSVMVRTQKNKPTVVSPSFQAWRRYDTDRSGYIEANELKVRSGP